VIDIASKIEIIVNSNDISASQRLCTTVDNQKPAPIIVKLLVARLEMQCSAEDIG